MAAESTITWELCLRANHTCFFVVISVDVRVDIPEVLNKVVLPEAGLHILHTFTYA